jgi:hypothetical protein
VLDVRRSADPFVEAQRQADALRACAGPGVPEVFDNLVDGARAILVIDPVRGIAIEEWIQRGLPSVGEALHVATQLTEILIRVHGCHLVHRSITPRGVCVDTESLQVSLRDFAQMRPLGSLAPAEVEGMRSLAALAYIAPEQTGRMNRGVDARSDLYSLGATLYFILTGRPPFVSSDLLALIHAHMARTVLSPAELRPELGGGLARMVLRLLNKQPEERYSSARSLLDDLRHARTELVTRGFIPDDFELGASEMPERPQFSRKLYGREREIEILERALERSAEGRLQAVLIRGEPGSGKSALVDAVRAPGRRPRGSPRSAQTRRRARFLRPRRGQLVLRSARPEEVPDDGHRDHRKTRRQAAGHEVAAVLRNVVHGLQVLRACNLGDECACERDAEHVRRTARTESRSSFPWKVSSVFSASEEQRHRFVRIRIAASGALNRPGIPGGSNP